MGLDASFLEMLVLQATWQPYTGNDTWGNDTWGASSTIKCWIDGVEQQRGDTPVQQEQVPTVDRAATLLTDALGVKVRDKITLPDGTVTHVVDAKTYYDEDATTLYQEVNVKTTEES